MKVEGFSIRIIMVFSLIVEEKRVWSIKALAYVNKKEDSPSFGFHFRIRNHVFYDSLVEAIDNIIEPSKQMGIMLDDHIVVMHNSSREVNDGWREPFLKEIRKRGWEPHIR